MSPSGELAVPDVVRALATSRRMVLDERQRYEGVGSLPGGTGFRAYMNTLDNCDAQVRAVNDWFNQLADHHHRLPVAADHLIEATT